MSATPKALGYTGRVNLMATPVVAETVISPAITGASPSPKSRKLVTLKVTSPSGEVATKRVAVDGYCWLHRGAYSCAEDLCLGRRTTRFLRYVSAMLDLLERAGAAPTVVLDGAYL